MVYSFLIPSASLCSTPRDEQNETPTYICFKEFYSYSNLYVLTYNT